MTGRDIDWEMLRAEWLRTADAASAVASAERQMKIARRSVRAGDIIESGIAGVASALVGLALMHAANRMEAALGVLVGALIGAAWLRRRDLARDEQRALEATTSDHLAMMRTLRKRQARLAEFIWVILALDLVFLIPWWIIGSRVHSRRLSDLGSIETMWIPLLGMVLLAIWAARSRASAKRDLAVLDLKRKS
jgi:hypothetical protein